MPGFYYRTTSAINGQPIIVAAVVPASVGNTKTGKMAQVYILPDVQQRPTASWADGTYTSVCGDCKHHTHNSCYVVRLHGSRAVHDAIQAGSPSYELVTPEEFARRLGEFDDVRWGADGDPAAIPKTEWFTITRFVKRYTAYTHQWKHTPHLRVWAMASCDTPEEAAQAHAQGWRYFRTRLPEEPIAAGEFVCPASEEGGHRVQCIDCGACSGIDPTKPRQANPVIIAHKATKKYRTMRLAIAG